MCILTKAAFAVAVLLLFTNCASKDQIHELVISTPDQRLALYRNGKPIRVYPVSTSKFGLGDRRGSNRTPIGRMVIARKIGTGAPSGAVFDSRRRTGEILRPNAPGRDPIVTRILWLKGREGQNRNAYRRYIYIHGTPQESMIGIPASYGCIRMRSRDIIDLYDQVGVGAAVTVGTGPMSKSAQRWWDRAMRSQGVETGRKQKAPKATPLPGRIDQEGFPRTSRGFFSPPM